MQALRIALFRVHAWLGLNTCILLGIMFATGTLMVFSLEGETAFYAKARSGAYPGGAPISLGQVYEAARTAYPDVQINNLVRSDVGGLFGDRVNIRTAWGEKAQVWVDPGTGGILGTSPAEGVRSILISFHDSLFTDNWMGRGAVTILAFSLLGSLVTGLIAYRRFWRGLKTLPPRGRGARPWWGGMHRFVAVWSLPFLLVVAVTGIYYFVSVLNVIPTKGPKLPSGPERAEALPPGFNGAAIDQAVASARAAVPGLDVRSVFLPTDPKQSLKIFGQDGSSPLRFGIYQVGVDPVTMQTLGVLTPSQVSPKDRAKRFFDALHHGDWAGNYSRFAWLFFGAAGTLLMFSGAMVFAARIARVPRPGETRPEARSAARRVWRGMFMVKWGLLPLALAVAALGIYRFYWLADRWTAIDPETPGSGIAKIAVLGDLREAEPLLLRLRLNGADAEAVEVQFGEEAPRSVPVKDQRQVRAASFKVQPGPGRNILTVRIDRPGAEPETLRWVLGRPVL